MGLGRLFESCYFGVFQFELVFEVDNLGVALRSLFIVVFAEGLVPEELLFHLC